MMFTLWYFVTAQIRITGFQGRNITAKNYQFELTIICKYRKNTLQINTEALLIGEEKKTKQNN